MSGERHNRSRDSLYLSAQLNSEWQRSGINFRIMLVGESGLGKSTFTRALLRPFVPDHLLDESLPGGSETLRTRTTEITEIVHKVENDGIPVEFTVIDCPGFGDAPDCTPWINSIVDYVRKRFSEHYEMLGSPPKHGAGSVGLQCDGLVHVCLYFIAAHRLKGVDLEFMRRLEPYVNLVPVIAKSDTMTLSERDAFRRLIISELRASAIQIFELCEAPPTTTPIPPVPAVDPDPTPREPNEPGNRGADGATPTKVLSRSATQPPPFAVCSSEDGTRVYPWGTCCVENPTHSDLPILRSRLFASSMLTAKRRTLELYERSYAAHRRKREAAQAAREARALRRERFLSRSVIVLAEASVIAAAAASILNVVRPTWSLAARTAVADTVKDPEHVRQVLGSAFSRVGMGVHALFQQLLARQHWLREARLFDGGARA